jgi:hypothetical protein
MRLPRKLRRFVFCPVSFSLLACSAVLLAPGISHAQVTANPPELTFGDVQIGTKSTLPLLLTNQSSSMIRITKGEVQGTGFIVDAKLPIVLLPGQQFALNVTFAPHTYGPYSSVLSGSDVSGSLLGVPLAGNGTLSGYSVKLTWDVSTSRHEIVGYNVYRGTTNGGPYTKINSVLNSDTNYTDYKVRSGLNYYYVTTAVDSNGQQSAYSIPTEAAIP